MNQNESESFRPWIHSDWFWFKIRFRSIRAQIDSDWKLGFGFIRIDVSELIGLSRIDCWPLLIKRDTKSFSDSSDWCLGINRIKSDWFLTVFNQTRYKTFFGLVRIGSDTHIGINRNSSDWLGRNSNPILSPGLSSILSLVNFIRLVNISFLRII